MFKFPDDWYIKPTFQKIRENIYMHLLSNNKLLLHFFLKERRDKCKVTDYRNKIYILDLNDYKLIHFKEFESKIKITVLNNYICIKDLIRLNIYNINDYKLVNDLELTLYDSSIKKYKDNILIEFMTSGVMS